MRLITLSAACTVTVVLLGMCIVTIATRATESSWWYPISMPTSTSGAVLRDYQLRDVHPCLIGLAYCPSTYPPPSPCLVSTTRCSGDARLQWAATDLR